MVQWRDHAPRQGGGRPRYQACDRRSARRFHGGSGLGIHVVATSNMENALRIVSVERGRDPRLYTMVAFGGAGPLHAARLARAVGIPTVIVPYGAGVGSAVGLLQAEPRIDVTVTRFMHLDAKRSGAEIAGVYRELEAQAMQDV